MKEIKEKLRRAIERAEGEWLAGHPGAGGALMAYEKTLSWIEGLSLIKFIGSLTTDELVEVKEAAAEILQKREEAAAGPKQEFTFSGDNHTHVCRQKGAHEPHTISFYRAGDTGARLKTFCLGREGEISKGAVVRIRTTHYSPGDPAHAAKARGYWWIEKVVSQAR